VAALSLIVDVRTHVRTYGRTDIFAGFIRSKTYGVQAANRAYLVKFLRSHFGVFWGLALLLGYLATSGAKSYSCSATPMSYKGDGISRVCRLIFDI